MESMGREEIIQIILAATRCRHAEPGYRIAKPLLLIAGENDNTGNIRKVMPVWAGEGPSCCFEIIPGARIAPNLDNSGLFHDILMALLLGRCR